MIEKIELSELVHRLVEIAYPELIQSNIKIQWGQTSSFATISWSQDTKDIRIRCPAQCKTNQS
jgi:hypothetical protein